jgi:hypothetical protein
MPICLKFLKRNSVDKWFTYFECFGDGLHLVFHIDNFFHHGCPFFQQIILVLQLNCPLVYKCLSWISPKINLTCMGLGLLEIDFGNQVLCEIGTGISFGLLVCYDTGIIHLIHLIWFLGFSGLPRTYSAIYVLEFLIMHHFPLSKGHGNLGSCKEPHAIVTHESFHPPWP